MPQQYRPQPKTEIEYSITGVTFVRGFFMEYDETNNKVKVMPKGSNKPRWVDAKLIRPTPEDILNRVITDDPCLSHSSNGSGYEADDLADTGIEQD
jgi:hypothetical protein